MSAKIRNYFELCKFFMHFFEAVLKQKQQKKITSKRADD